jgi:hypothetical protein
LIVTNLLKHRSVVGWIAMNLTNRHSVLDLNINQCTSGEKQEYVTVCWA